MGDTCATIGLQFSAVVLAGGRSSRMGREKAWLEVDGQPLLARQIALARSLGPVEVLLSGRADADYTSFGCPVLTDRVADAGPLAGLAVALETARAPLLLVLAVDLPHMTTDALERMLVACEPERGVVPRLAGQLEPLAAVYPCSCAALAYDQLHHGRRAVRDFAARCEQAARVRYLDLPPEWQRYFMNWNSPADLAATPPSSEVAPGQGAGTRSGLP
jgi:molybdopterin-guanine dinucleotide biosynthesis protein A